MALRCNINSRGRVIRLLYGTLMLALAGFLAGMWALSAGEIWRWVICGVIAAAGILGLIEAWLGWCIVRAMGFKTPM